MIMTSRLVQTVVFAVLSFVHFVRRQSEEEGRERWGPADGWQGEKEISVLLLIEYDHFHYFILFLYFCIVQIQWYDNIILLGEKMEKAIQFVDCTSRIIETN